MNVSPTKLHMMLNAINQFALLDSTPSRLREKQFDQIISIPEPNGEYSVLDMYGMGNQAWRMDQHANEQHCRGFVLEYVGKSMDVRKNVDLEGVRDFPLFFFSFCFIGMM